MAWLFQLVHPYRDNILMDGEAVFKFMSLALSDTPLLHPILPVLKGDWWYYSCPFLVQKWGDLRTKHPRDIATSFDERSRKSNYCLHFTGARKCLRELYSFIIWETQEVKECILFTLKEIAKNSVLWIYNEGPAIQFANFPPCTYTVERSQTELSDWHSICSPIALCNGRSSWFQFDCLKIMLQQTFSLLTFEMKIFYFLKFF